MAEFTPNTNLNFGRLWGDANANLNFGSADDQTVDPNTVNGTGDAYYNLTGTVASEAYYDSNVFRGLITDVSSSIQNCKIQAIDKQGQFESNKQLTSDISADWQQSKLISTDNQAQFEANIKLSTDSQLLFESAKHISTDNKQSAEYQTFIAIKTTLSNEGAKLAGHSRWFGFEAMLKRQTERKLVGEYSELIGVKKSTDSQYAKLSGRSFEQLIEFAKLPPWVGYRDDVVIPDKTFDSSTNLHFACDWLPDTNLHFGTICYRDNELPEPIPLKGVIFVTNSVSLVRSDDARNIQMYSFNVGIDDSSYAWSFSATVPLTELSKVNTAIEQRIGVEFTCNGNLWRFILDGCNDSISFGESTLTITGKSRAMLLASPYAAPRDYKYSTSLTSRQIAEDELNRNSIPSGFTLDWDLVDALGWNVPADTYSYTGRTPINSLQAIAEAAGGFINAHMSQDIIHVLERYPVASWDWAAQTPTLNIPMSLIKSRSQTRANNAAYNGVQVWGTKAGSVGALVKRTGTAGGYQPSMITNDLITDNAVARARGIAELSNTGDMGTIGLVMPLHNDFGVLKPSTLIGVNDGESWTGMVRGTSISGSLSSNRTLEIEQSLDIERHYDKG